MKTYEFSIKTCLSVIGSGELFEPQTVFETNFQTDGNIDVFAFAKQLFSFWKDSHVMGECQNSWEYEYSLDEK